MAAVYVLRNSCILRRNVALPRFLTDCTRTRPNCKFDTSLLDVLVCPLSKKPLRYDEVRNELVCDELNVAYPITNGMASLIPTDARIIREDTGEK